MVKLDVTKISYMIAMICQQASKTRTVCGTPIRALAVNLRAARVNVVVHQFL